MTKNKDKPEVTGQLTNAAVCHCGKCQFQWISNKILNALLLKKPIELPATCPRCHSYSWQNPLIRKPRTKRVAGKPRRKH